MDGQWNSEGVEGGVSKAYIFNWKFEEKLEFPEGGFKQKNNKKQKSVCPGGGGGYR